MRFLSADPGRIGRRHLQGVVSAVLCLAAVTTSVAAFVLPESTRRDVAPVVANDGWLNLTVIHTNDVHSRVDPANEFGVSCTDQDRASGHCYGGTARHKTVIERLRKANQHSLLLDGGDEVCLPVVCSGIVSFSAFVACYWVEIRSLLAAPCIAAQEVLTDSFLFSHTYFLLTDV